MSYCVNCGVELDATAARCPLCFTPVCNPLVAVDTDGPTPFPVRDPGIAPVSKRELALLLSIMLASAAVGCGLLNLFLRPDRMWSMYLVGAVVMLWVWVVPPLLFRRMPNWVRLTLDVLAIGIYVYLISVEVGGREWFFALALPVILAAAVAVLCVSLLLRGNRRSTLMAIVAILCAVGLFAMAVEYFADRYWADGWSASWSLVVLTVCLALSVPLVIVRSVPSLRAEARRRFHL